MSQWSGIDEFLAVATTGSFTKGARSINMSPTHVSRAIIALEQRVQAQLFYRTTRTVRLTDTGRVFFERCQRIVQERDEAIALIAEDGEPQGELRVTCSTTMGERFVSPILRRFAMNYPKLNVSIELTNRVVDLVAEGFDLAIRTGRVDDPRLIATQVASRMLRTCVAPAYRARHGVPDTPEDLDQHECLIGTGANWHFQKKGHEMIYRPGGRFRCNSGQAVVEACVSGMGICQVPDFYIIPYLKHGMVEVILDQFQPQNEPIWAVYPQRRHLLPKVRQVVEALRQEMGPLMVSAA